MSALRAVPMLRLSRAALARSVAAPSRGFSSLHAGRTASASRTMAVPVMQQIQRRGYAASSGLSQQEIQNRIFDVLKSFEKVDPAKISASASFASDLGLDSLDAVEAVMAIEEEFSIEIPDAEADNITSVQQAIDYIAKTPSAH